MGFSHAWYRPQVLEAAKFRAATEDFKKMLPSFKAKGIVLIDPEQHKPKPAITAHLIHFTGKPGVEHFFIEAMFTDRKNSRGQCFAYCKTEHQPYDYAVLCALLIFKHHFGEPFKVCSDGKLPEWAPAIAAVRATLGYQEFWNWEEKDDDGCVDRYLVAVKEDPCQVQPASSASSPHSKS